MDNVTNPEILDLVGNAAFIVKDRIITHANNAAQQRQVLTGANIREYICVGSQEYDSFHSGKLYLQLNITGIFYTACVTSYKESHLFTILSNYDSNELQALALAATHLKGPLQNILSGVSQLSKDLPNSENSANKEAVAQISKNLYRLIRAVGNMTDASSAPANRIRQFVYGDITQAFKEWVDKIKVRLTSINRTLSFSGLSKPIYTMFDGHSVERALYNLISNAVKFSPEYSEIMLKVSSVGNRLYITVENNCLTSPIRATQFFDHYLREPGIEEDRFGIGLGLSVVRNIALAHHGTLLITHKENNVISSSITLAITDNSTNVLKSPINIKVDYSGGLDLSFVELSDVLLDHAYEEL